MNLASLNLRIPKLRQRDITLAILVVSLLLAVLWYFYLFTPTRENISQLESQISSLQNDVRQGELAQANLPELEASLAKAKQDRDDFLAELPAESEVANLLESFRREAENNNVILSSISRSSARPSAAPDVRSLGFSLSTAGDYVSTMGFLASLERLKRFTKISSVNFAVSNDNSTDNPDLSTNYDINVFIYTGLVGD